MPVKRPLLHQVFLSNRRRFRHTFIAGLLVGLIALVLVYPFSATLKTAGSRSFWGASFPVAGARPAQGGCTVACTATVAPTGEIGQSTAFTATAMTSACAGNPTFQWDFGDDTGSTQQNPSHFYTTGGLYQWRLTVESLSQNAVPNISTVAGGGGEGDAALDVPFARLLVIARDPAGRGVYLVNAPHGNDTSGRTRIAFLNTGSVTATVAGQSIAPATVRTVAGGGAQVGEDLPGLVLDLGSVTGLATNPSGDLLYFTEQTDSRIRVLNVSAAPVSVRGTPLAPGEVRTFAKPMVMDQPLFADLLFGLAYHPTTNDLIVADATPGISKVYKVHQDGTAEVVAGNGEITRTDEVFEPGPGTGVPLLNPRAVDVDGAGAVLIADSGHSRIIRVASNGATTLVRQFDQGRGAESSYPIGLTVGGTTVFSANGNEHQIVRASGAQGAITGQFRETCNYVQSNCGDGGPATAATLALPMSDGEVTLAGIEGETSGVYVLDQSVNQRGRVRYVNTSGVAVTRAGVIIPPGGIATIAGSGFEWPFDGGKGTGASFRAPVGVAADSNRNLFISDTGNARIRFLNRSGSTVNLFQGTPAAQSVPPGTIVTINYLGGSAPGQTAPAHVASFEHPQGMTITSNGLYIADTRLGPFVPPGFSGRLTSLVRFLNTTASTVTLFPQSESPISVPAGFVATIAGADTSESTSGNGDGGFARGARFFGLSDVAVDANGNIYLTEVAGSAVRRIDGATGIVSSLATGAGLFTGLAIAPDGRLFITDATGGRLLRQNTPGGAAFSQLASGLGSPRDVAIDLTGRAIVTNAAAHRLLGVAPNGAVSIVAGTTEGFSGDGGPATDAQISISPGTVNIGQGAANQLLQTVGIAVTALGEIFFTDVGNGRIRRLGPDIVSCTRTGTIAVNNPVPSLTTMAPLTGRTEGPAFTLTLTGTNFVGNSVVRWKGSNRVTTFVSGTELKAEILSSDLATSGNAAVTVFNPGPGGGLSATLNFSITNPLPVITLITPNNVVAGSSGFSLEIEGADFISTSVVRWNGVARQTAFASSRLLSINVPASDIAVAGTVNITVHTPPPGGGTTGVIVLTINNPVPTITALVPNTTQGGGPAFTLTVTGTNFVNGSIVRWNGESRPTTFVSSTEVKAEISAANIAAGGEKSIVVFNPGPGGGLSNAGAFGVTSPPPTIVSLSPSTATAGANGFVLTVTGTNFNAASVVRWNDSDRATVFVNQTTITATIPTTDVANTGSAMVTVVSPPPGGGVSNALTFTVTNPVPILTSVEPNRIVAGSSDILITINGTQFVGGSVVRWNGQNRVTTFVSPTQLKVVILGTDLAAVGEGLITVFNPAPDGGTSAALPFTIFPPNPNPVITSLSRTIEVAGAPGFVLTVRGASLIASSQVLWNGVARTTTFVSATELTASIPGSDLANPGVAQVSIFTPGPGGGTTNPLTFTIATPLTTVSAASFLAGPVSGGSIVAGFGSGLAVGTAGAASSPLPTLLLGTYIVVTDSAGVARQAPLFFVSPAQSNFLIPELSALGPATIDVTSGDGKASRGTIEIVAAALSIFSANSDGMGVAAANLIRAVGTTLSVEEVAQFVGGVWVPKCFGLGPPIESVFLILYGTGLKGSSAGLTITATIGGVTTPVAFAGAQGTFVGLDQLNLGPIPRQLIGAGVVDVIVRVNGVASNTVRVCIN